MTDYQYTPAPEGDIYQYTEAPEAPKDDQLHNDDIYQYNQDQGPNFGPNGAKEEVSKVLPGEEPGTFERIFNYFTGWGSKNKETTNTSPETPSWEKTRQGREEANKCLFWAWQICHGPLNVIHWSPRTIRRPNSNMVVA